MGRKWREPAPLHPLAYKWHMARRRRLQGRLTAGEWLDWADEYIDALKPSPWRTWCRRQVREFEAVHYYVTEEA